MNVRPLESADRAAYDELALRHGTLFNRWDWLELFGDRMQALGLFDEGGTLVGGLSIFQERRLGLRIWRRAPFTPSCGPFFAPKAQNPVAILEERRAALDAMADHVEREAPAICMLPLDRRIQDVLPFFWRGFKVVPNYTYLLDLAPAPEELLKNMSPERRKNIGKAGRDGLVVRAETDLRVVRELVLGTFRRQEKFVDEPCLDAVLFRYAKPSNSFAFVTCRDEMPIAACFVVHDGQTAYYLLGGYHAAERHHGAGAAAMFAAIRHARDLGLKTFDFEGSVIPAIERYFRGFGGQATPYFTINKAWLPIEIALKFSKRNFF